MRAQGAGGAAIGLGAGIAGARPRAGFLGGASRMVAGTVAGQAAVILASPLLTRLYTPEEFGALGVYAAIHAFAVALSTLRYEIAIPMPRTDRGAAPILALSLACVAGATALCAAAVAALGPRIAAWANTPYLAPWLWALPVGTAVGGAHAAFTYWGMRKSAFGVIGWTRFQQGGGMAAVQALLGWLHWGVPGLIAGHVLGLSAGLTNLVRGWLRDGAAAMRSATPRRMLAAARQHRDLPLFSSWGSLVNIVGLQLPVMLFASLYSPAVVGLYLLGQRVANAPVALVSEAVGKVFYVSAVEARRDGRLAGLSLRVFEILLKASLAPFAVLAVAAPEIFGLVFGAAWTEAGTYLQWMVAWIAASFVFVPLLTLCATLQLHRADLAFQAVLVAVRLGCIWIGSLLGGPVLAVALFSAGAAATYSVFGCRLLRAAGVAWGDIGRAAIRETGVAALAGGALWAMKAALAAGGSGPGDPVLWAFLAAALSAGVASLGRARKTLKELRDLPGAGR